MENPDEFEIDDEGPEVSEEEYQKSNDCILSPTIYIQNIIADPHLYRHTCWKLKDRGAVGETILHLCLLNATSLHADIAKRLLRFYPKLINDIYISDEYYGNQRLLILDAFAYTNSMFYRRKCVAYSYRK